MKNFAILFFVFRFSFFIFHLNSMAQGCLTEGITFSSQSQIDSFQVNYPGCISIEGDVIIHGSNINNLIGLNVLSSIEGDLVIGEPWGWNANPALANLTGLENLTSVNGNLTLESNAALASLTGLENLSSIGGSLKINDNPLLTSITSLGELTSIGGGICLGTTNWLGNPRGNPVLTSLAGLGGITSSTYLTLIGNHTLSDLTGINNLQSISGSILIGGNDTLSSLGGLEQLSYIGENLQFGYSAHMGWFNNPLLHHLTGLEGLTEIDGKLAFLGSALLDLEGLSNLVSIGNDLVLQDNNALPGIVGLNSLDSINGNLVIGPYPGIGGEWIPGGNPALLNFAGVENLSFIGGDFLISKNDSLSSLSGFENLVSIGGDLFINAHFMLADISDLENIEAASIENLEIDYNYSLADCDIRAICDYLADPNGTVEIHNNAPGCSSQDEVEAACGVGVGESAVVGRQSSVSVYPNPTGGIVDFRISNFDGRWGSLKIYNSQGLEVATVLEGKWPGGQVVRWDAGTLPAGVYYYLLKTDDRRLTTGKIVKY